MKIAFLPFFTFATAFGNVSLVEAYLEIFGSI